MSERRRPACRRQVRDAGWDVRHRRVRHCSMRRGRGVTDRSRPRDRLALGRVRRRLGSPAAWHPDRSRPRWEHRRGARGRRCRHQTRDPGPAGQGHPVRAGAHRAAGGECGAPGQTLRSRGRRVGQRRRSRGDRRDAAGEPGDRDLDGDQARPRGSGHSRHCGHSRRSRHSRHPRISPPASGVGRSWSGRVGWR